jgi:outer membrane biosynthesis protein TonB
MSQGWICVLIALALSVCGNARGQNSDSPAHGRKLIHREAPVYPDLARRVSLSGAVKLIATVAPSGSVKTVEPVGGNPVLLKAAQEAVMSSKYAPAPTETKELIELRFAIH